MRLADVRGILAGMGVDRSTERAITYQGYE